MQSCSDSFSTVVAYASIASSSIENDHDFKLLKAWCLKIPFEIETLAEEIHPSERNRPLWNEVLQKLERRAITTLVVPSLFHIAGDDFINPRRHKQGNQAAQRSVQLPYGRDRKFRGENWKFPKCSSTQSNEWTR